MSNIKITSLGDERARREFEHAAKVRKLFDDHPEIARTAIIVVPDYGMTLTPEDMSVAEVVGVLEQAKFGIQRTNAEFLESDE